MHTYLHSLSAMESSQQHHMCNDQQECKDATSPRHTSLNMALLHCRTDYTSWGQLCKPGACKNSPHSLLGAVVEGVLLAA